MPETATMISCHCGAKFEKPQKLEGRRVNCPTCNSVIFLSMDKAPDAPEEETDTYGFHREEEETPQEKKKHSHGVEGVPDWLDHYRESKTVKKGDREKLLAQIEHLGKADAAKDPLGAALYLATTHADAETSVAALTTVAMSSHPVYGPIARTLAEHVGPSDAGGSQQLLKLLGEAKEPQAEKVLVGILKKIGPTSLVQVRTLIELLESKHADLYVWGVQCLKLIGPPAKRSVETLLKTAKIANHDLRIAVIDALGAISQDGEHAIPLLLQALKHHSADYRAHAASALGHYAAVAPQIVGRLREVLKDEDPQVRQAATAALQSIATAEKAAATQPASAGSATAPPAEPIHVVCACGKKLRIKVELAGKKVKCPACSGVIAVPVPAPAPAPAAAAPAPTPKAAAEHECPDCWATGPATATVCVYCGHSFR